MLNYFLEIPVTYLEIGMVMERAIVVLGCDLVARGASLGPETIARCTCALNRYQELIANGVTPDILMSPGMANKEYYPAQKDTMAVMMAKWFFAQGIPADALHFVFSPLTWGTRAEINTALDYILYWRISKDGAVEFVSSTYHLLRIRLIAKRVLYSEIQNADNPLPKFFCLGVKCYSKRMLLETRNVIGEYVLGFFHPQWYYFRPTDWC